MARPPVAYLWARTVRCEAPNCGAEIPLVRSFWLRKKPKRKRALRCRVERPEGAPPRVVFEIFEPKVESEVRAGTVVRARATCPCCDAVLPPERVRAQLAEQHGGADATFDSEGRRVGGALLTAVVTLKPGETGRHYRLPTDADYAAVLRAQERLVGILNKWERNGQQGLCPVPDEPLPPIGTLGFRVQRYGMLKWGDLFTARQKVAYILTSDDIRQIQKENVNNIVADLLAFAIDKIVDFNCSLSKWRPSNEDIGDLFGRQALPPSWDFSETNLTEKSYVGLERSVDHILEVVANISSAALFSGTVQQADAVNHPTP